MSEDTLKEAKEPLGKMTNSHRVNSKAKLQNLDQGQMLNGQAQSDLSADHSSNRRGRKQDIAGEANQLG